VPTFASVTKNPSVSDSFVILPKTRQLLLNYGFLLFAETSDAGTTTGGRTTHEDAKPERGDAAADGDAVYRERASHERDRHLERNYQGEHTSLSCFSRCTLLHHNIPVTPCGQ
jgi:hypothetical protein